MNDIARRTPTLRDLLIAARPKLGEVCARHLPPDRLVRLAVAAIGRTPKLQECSPETVLSSVFIAGRLGLEPDGILGGAYLVPYGRDCQLIVGYRGLIDLAVRSGKVRSIVSRVVHERDAFKVVLGTNERLRHVPIDDEDEPGPWTHVYAVATLADGGKQFEVMTRRQVEAIKARSKARSNGPWMTDEEEMARKTVVRRLAKSLPLSTEFAAALTLQAGAEAGESNVSRVADELELNLSGAPAIDVTTTAQASKPKSVDELKAEAKAAGTASKTEQPT